MKRKAKFRVGQLAVRELKALNQIDYVRLESLTESKLWRCVDAMGESMGYASPKELRPLTRCERG